MVHGSGYEIIASQGCSDRTIRRRVTAWAHQGLGQKLHQITLAAYDTIIGLELDDLATDGCITKAPCGGEKAGPSPVDRRKGGLKRSVATDAGGVPLGIVSAGANRHDSPLLAPTIEATKQQVGMLPEKPVMHLDSGYDGKPSRLLAEHDLLGEIAKKGIPSPIQVGTRWVVERTHSWMNKLRQAPPLHRPRRHHRRLLPLPSRRFRHPPLPDPKSPPDLPLAGPPHHPPSQVTLICRSL